MGRKWGLDFDEEQLRRLVRQSPPRSRFFQVLRQELKVIGRWKNLPRGRKKLQCAGPSTSVSTFPEFGGLAPERYPD
jgi:hypothetical protein